MQLTPKQRPTYSMPPRYQFNHIQEYMTTHFYGAIAA